MMFLILFLFIPLIQCKSFSPKSLGTSTGCPSMTVGGCEPATEELIETYSLPSSETSVSTCQRICQVQEGCNYFTYNSQEEKCFLYHYRYLYNCQIRGASATPTLEECRLRLANSWTSSCDSFAWEDCNYSGNVVLSKTFITDANSCQRLLLIIGRMIGAEYFVYDYSQHTCTYYDSSEARCDAISGPDLPNIQDCGNQLFTISSKAPNNASSEKLSLVGGSKPNEGNVYYNGRPVCDDLWVDEGRQQGNKNGQVICRELGYSGLVRFYTDSHFGLVPEDFSMDDVRCTGTENHLEDCSHDTDHNCDNEEGAGVECEGESSQEQQCRQQNCPEKLRLVGGSKQNEGNVYYNGRPVCDDFWDYEGNQQGNKNGLVICRELGYSSFVRFYTHSHFGAVPTTFSMDNVKCTGTENHLEDCPHDTDHNCSSDEGAGVECEGESIHEQQCTQQSCPGAASCQNGIGEDYSGSVNKTILGFDCKKWSWSNNPQFSSVGDHNYCRNPDGEPGVWCFSTNPDEEWELCDVPYCV